MQYTTEAILLSATNWGEADKMLRFFSRARGAVKAAAFGCRRPRSALAGALQLFTVAEVTFQEGERIDTVRQAVVRQRFSALETNVEAMAYASFIAELVLALEAERVPNEPLFAWLPPVFAACTAHNPRIVALAAGWQLLALTGIGMQFDTCVSCGAPVAGDAFFAVREGGAMCAHCVSMANGEHETHATNAGDAPRSVDIASARNLIDAKPYDANLRQFLTSLIALSWTSPATFRVKKATLLEAEALFFGALQLAVDRPLKSVSFIQQLNGMMQTRSS